MAAIQFPAEDECTDCPAAESEDLLPPITLDLTSSSTSQVTLDNNRVGSTEETTKLESGLSSQVLLAERSDEDNYSSDDDEEDEEEIHTSGCIEGTEGKVRDRWKIEDGGNILCQCIICDHTTTSYDAADLMKDHIESSHGLSFEKLKTKFALDYLGFVQFVRWARKMKELGLIEERISSIWKLDHWTNNDLPWCSDDYLLPPSGSTQSKVPMDYFLTLDYFEDEQKEKATQPITIEDLMHEIDRLRLDKQRMTAAFHHMVGDVSDTPRKSHTVNATSTAQRNCVSTDSSRDRRQQAPRKIAYVPDHLDDADSHNKWYFDSYDDIVIHHDMIFDRTRTEAYQHAIIDRAEDIKGKVVMDLGCGSGILSMFCAQHGAKIVHAIDKSRIIFDAMSNSFENNLDEVIKFHNIDLDHDDTSDLDKHGKVDVLVSEFMGYFLLFEGMTQSFLKAREKYLKPGGILLPDKCMIEMAPLGPSGIYKRKVACWDAVFGFTMPAMKDRVIHEPLMEIVDPTEIIGSRVEMKKWDLLTCTAADIYINQEFEFEFYDDTEFCGVVGFFSVDFTGRTNKIVLATSPWDPSTHWKQTVFFFPKPIAVTKGQKMNGSIKCCPHKDDPRWLQVVLEFDGNKRIFYEMK